MPWYLCPYTRLPPDQPPGGVARRCAMNDFAAQLTADHAPWAETEVLGNTAVVKVSANASAATLALLDAAPGFTRIPVNRLADPLSTLSTAVLLAIKNKVLALGYTLPELTAALGTDLSLVTLGQLLRFVATRRFRTRYDAAADAIVLDGPQDTPTSLDVLDRLVP